MEKVVNYLDEQTYFRYFERQYANPVFKENYPLISKRMKDLCDKMKKTIYKSSPMCFFEVHAEILGLDAQLQIILSLKDLIDTNSEISEEMIIQCAKKDYPLFIRELCEYSSNDFLEHSLYFSVL